MATTGLNGPFVLTSTEINSIVVDKSPGAYALGSTSSGVFTVKYVGRSDDDLNSRLQCWVGEYAEFKASYFLTPQEAFEKECRLYHDFGESHSLDNSIHPAAPTSTSVRCPYNCA